MLLHPSSQTHSDLSNQTRASGYIWGGSRGFVVDFEPATPHPPPPAPPPQLPHMLGAHGQPVYPLSVSVFHRVPGRSQHAKRLPRSRSPQQTANAAPGQRHHQWPLSEPMKAGHSRPLCLSGPDKTTHVPDPAFMTAGCWGGLGPWNAG